MGKAYHSGSRNEVLIQMARFAIRDQETLVDALRPQCGIPDEDTQEAIDAALNRIKDFKRILVAEKSRLQNATSF